MKQGMDGARRWFVAIGMAAALAVPAVPALAQQSDSYKFIDAVTKADGAKVTELLDRPGNTLINLRADNGDTALHIVTRRRDSTYLGFLLARGADPDARDHDGNTPLMIASLLGFEGGVQTLVDRRANVNLANNRGETPLIIAVQRQNLPMVRLLLSLGANPAQPDRVTGMSARDYAAQDRRLESILRLIDSMPRAAPAAPIQGPH